MGEKDMRFSIEELYSMYGRYDKVITINFYPGSEAQKKYCNNLTGTIIYTQQDRETLEELIKQEKVPRTNGNVRFNDAFGEDVNEESGEKMFGYSLSEFQVKELVEGGFKSADILEIWSTNWGYQNKFIHREKREIPTINISLDLSNIDLDLISYNQFRDRLEEGFLLTYEECDEYCALLLRYDSEKIDTSFKKKYIIDSKTQKIKKNIRFYYLRNKFLHEKLTENETKEFEELQMERAKQKSKILLESLQDAGTNFKKLHKEKTSAAMFLLETLTTFETESLIFTSKHPVYWDLKQYLHIFLRHVEEMKTGENYSDKTVFQFWIKDIKRLIINVLEFINKEVQEHFEKSPGLPFHKYENQSIYYDGDYYTVHIDETGKLITLHKNKKNN